MKITRKVRRKPEQPGITCEGVDTRVRITGNRVNAQAEEDDLAPLMLGRPLSLDRPEARASALNAAAARAMQQGRPTLAGFYIGRASELLRETENPEAAAQQKRAAAMIDAGDVAGAINALAEVSAACIVGLHRRGYCVAALVRG